MSTRQQLRSQFYTSINETEGNSKFTPDEANALINQALPLIAVRISYPRDISWVPVEQGIGAYTVPDDFIFLRTAYFGDLNKSGDIQKLRCYKEETLSEIDPNWLDETDGAEGRPNKIMLLDKHTFFIHPRPNADSAGKVLIIGYVYKPQILNDDTSIPDFHDVYHDCIQFYAAGMAYIGKLENKDKADLMFKRFADELASRSPTLETETQETMRMQWGYDE